MRAISARCCDILRNEVSDAPYSGISYSSSAEHRHGGESARIEDNTVSRVLKLLNDGGAIYVTFTRNGVIRGNVIRDIQQGDEPDSGRNGIYLDEQTEGWLVEKNLVISCTHPVLCHMAGRNTIRQNIFVSGSWLKVNLIRCAEFAFTHNIVYAKSKLIFYGNPGAVTDFANNLLFSVSGEVEEHHVDDNYKHYDTLPLALRDGTRIADPLFADAETNDYSLQPGSPAFLLGIEGIIN